MRSRLPSVLPGHWAASEETKTILIQVQKQLYGLMTELSASQENAVVFSRISETDIAWLEGQVAQIEKIVELPREFILPGETPGKQRTFSCPDDHPPG